MSIIMHWTSLACIQCVQCVCVLVRVIFFLYSDVMFFHLIWFRFARIECLHYFSFSAQVANIEPAKPITYRHKMSERLRNELCMYDK